MTRFVLRNGAIFGAVMVALGLVYRLAHLPPSSPMVWVFYGAIPVAAFAALFRYGRSGERPGWRKGLGVAFGVTFLGALIYSMFSWLYNGLIDDSLIQEWRRAQLELATQRAKTPEDLQAAVTGIEALAQPFAMARAVLFQMTVTAAGCSLLLATALKLWPRKRPI